ncbi:MAG: putative oxidoreductase [Myxococcota bacterium]|jgi:putative oxidoreductase
MSDFALLLLRVVAGFGLATHGYQKIVEGGFEGVEGFADYLESLGIPAPLASAWISKTVELVGGACIIVGLFTRPAAILCAITMLVAILTAHLGDPFAKWELALLYFATMTAIALLGSGKYSIDAKRRA